MKRKKFVQFFVTIVALFSLLIVAPSMANASHHSSHHARIHKVTHKNHKSRKHKKANHKKHRARKHHHKKARRKNKTRSHKKRSRGDLYPFRYKHYKYVNNHKYYRGYYSTQRDPAYNANPRQNVPDYLNTVAGNGSTTFTSKYFLPTEYNGLNTSNPQSVAIANGYAYVMYTVSPGSTNGFVIRYNLGILNSYGVTNYGSMSKLRDAAYDNNNPGLLSSVKAGPVFDTGHGQSLAYDSKTNELWFVRKLGRGGKGSEVARLNPDSLMPDYARKFNLRHDVNMGENLTFDNSGNAYFYRISHGKKKHSVRIYRGHIGTTRLHFKLLKRGIRYAPGAIAQSMGYNPQSNSLYLISDGGITRFPAGTLNHLSKGKIHTVITDGFREFEGLAFEPNGTGYLLVNKGPELMQLSNSNF